jgi:predicted dehydrogenase
VRTAHDANHVTVMNPNLTRREFLRTAGAATIAAASLSPALAQSDKKITLALVGAAHIHVPGFRKDMEKRNDVRVKFVWDHSAARAEKWAKEFGAEAARDPEQVWSDPEVSTVVIYSETNRHHELVLAAARARKNMYVEKPLGITARESLAMAEAIEKSGVLFTTGYFMRTDPKHIFLKQEIALGHFGQVTRARGTNCHNGALAGWFDTDYRWMTDPKIAGVGAFGDLGTHKLDILMWLLGDVESVTADVKSVTGRYGDCDETGEGLIQFKNGVIGSLAAGWVDIQDPVTLVISGTEGHAVIQDNHLYYRSTKVPGTDSNDPYTKLPPASLPPIYQLLDAVAGDKNQPLVPPREAAARVMVMEAMYRAAKERTWVKTAG